MGPGREVSNKQQRDKIINNSIYIQLHAHSKILLIRYNTKIKQSVINHTVVGAEAQTKNVMSSGAGYAGGEIL